MRRKIKSLKKYYLGKPTQEDKTQENSWTRFVSSPLFEDIVVRPEDVGGNLIEQGQDYSNWDPNIRYLVGGQDGMYRAGVPTYDNSWQNYWGNRGAGYVNRAQNAAAPVVAGVLGAAAALPAMSIGAGALGTLSGVLPSVGTVAGELAAAELAGMGWNQAYKWMSGKDWSTGVADAIESATGWRPSEGAASMTNPGYFMGGVAKKGVEATIDAAKGFDNALWNGIQMANGRWVNIGGREFRLDPNTAGINGRPLRMKRPRIGQRPVATAEPELNPNAIFGFSREGEPVGLNNTTATNTQAATNRFRAATIGERPSVINPVRGTLEVRANVAEAAMPTSNPSIQAALAGQRVINPPTVSEEPILESADRLNSAVLNGGHEFNEVLNELGESLGLSHLQIMRYANNHNVDLHSPEGRQALLRDAGYRLDSHGGAVSLRRTTSDNYLVDAARDMRREYYDNNPDKAKEIFKNIADKTGMTPEELRTLLANASNGDYTSGWVNHYSWPDTFSKYKNEDEVIKGFFDNLENLQALAENGKDITKHINPTLRKIFAEFDVPDSRIQELFKRGFFHKRAFADQNNLVKDLRYESEAGSDMKKFLNEEPFVPGEKEIKFSDRELSTWMDFFNRRNRLHPDLWRIDTLSKNHPETAGVLRQHPEYTFDEEGLLVDKKGNYVKSPRGTIRMNKELEDAFNNMKAAEDFSIFESLGGAFSANSSPFMAKMSTKLSRLRAKQGRFPGMLKLHSYRTSNGNPFADVNVGTYEEPSIGGEYGYTPTKGEMRKFPNRKQAENHMNLEFAKMYKEMIKNSEGISGMPDYGIDPDMLDAVIKAGGDIYSVPNAADATFKNSMNGTPVWIRFPETSIEPVYPAFDWVFDSGKSIRIKPANKGKFNATKKRTGKTTEQLAHSKNPLTRKRAIFALNARKWKH